MMPIKQCMLTERKSIWCKSVKALKAERGEF